MDDYQAIVFACLAVIVAIYVVRWYNDPLHAICTVGGSSLPVLSYLGAWRMQGDCRAVLEEGYRKYVGSVFKIPSFDGWRVIVSGRDMVEEITRKRPDELSGPHASREVLQADYLFERSVIMDVYHAEAIREKLGRRLQTIMPDVFDEVAAAVRDHIVVDENEWTRVAVMHAMQKIVARASNRAFVGLPLCRNEEFLAVAVDFSVGFLKSITALWAFPRFLKPIVALFINFPKWDTRRAVPFLRPIIEERQRAEAELGEGWNDKPNDLLQSLLDKATGRNEPAVAVAQRLLIASFAAIHTTSITITHALYLLAEKPKIVAPLREEIEVAIAADGWTSTALANMWKLDSLFREILRLHGISMFIGRRAMKDVVLSDGTRIPEGTVVNALPYALHRDEALYENARTFDPFRFERMRIRSAEGTGAAKHQCASTSPEYIPFGHGPHACPGRFFAANELKAILGYIVVNFDMKFGADGKRPPGVYSSAGVIPAPHGRVLFKKRKTSI